MNYISMYKNYYILNNQFNDYYQDILNSQSSIKFNFYIHDNQAFVHINNELLKLVEDIYDLNNKVVALTSGNRKLPKVAIEWIIHHILIEEIHQSNTIEGVVSTRKEIKQLINGMIPKGYKRFSGLVNKYEELLNQDNFLIENISDVKELYDKVLLKDIRNEDVNNIPDGEFFRKHRVNVHGGEKIIHEGISGEKEVNSAMSEAIHILNDESLCLLVRVAIFHYLIGYIHPYYDGNGRLSRLISSGYLSNKLDVISALQLSVSCFKHKSQYYEIFKTTNDVRNKADLTYFTIAFLEILKDGLIKIIDFTSIKVEQYNYYSENIYNCFKERKKTTVINVLLQCTLFAIEGLTVKELSQVCCMSEVTMRNYLNDLDKRGLIHNDKESQPYKYTLDLEKLDKLI